MTARSILGAALVIAGALIILGFVPLTTLAPVDDGKIVPIDDGNGTAPPAEDAEIAQDYWQMFGVMLLVSGVIIAYSDEYKKPGRG